MDREELKARTLEYARRQMDSARDEWGSIHEWLTFVLEYPDEVAEEMANEIAGLLPEVSLSFEEASE